MKKIFLIGLKDVTLVFRDRTALMFMLLTPFLLTLGLGFVTGRFSGSNSTGLSHIPVVLVNQDGSQLGNDLVNVFESNDLADLVSPIRFSDTTLARQQVDDNKAAAAVIIPAGFTDSIIPKAGEPAADKVVQIDLYTNPTTPTSAAVIKSIVGQFLGRLEQSRIAGEVTVTQLLDHGLIQVQDAGRIGAEIGRLKATSTANDSTIRLDNVTAAGQPVKTDVLAYLAPGMALMFLMYTVSSGGRTLLAERAQGTLPRLLVSPTTTTQVLAGKVFGIYLTGVAQMLILIAASQLFFQLDWGSPIAITALLLASVAGAVGWAMLITALAKTPAQVSNTGSALMLIFGILGGGFINMNNMPAWLQIASKISPNAWGLDGFSTLAAGGQLADIYQPLSALLVMGIVLFGLAVIIFNRRGMAGR
ncbi:MAG: ABC transporter permease [Anaerolineaceae bacterium]|nr:ABC transporter permease [Anaerolineaceae bacterium]